MISPTSDYLHVAESLFGLGHGSGLTLARP